MRFRALVLVALLTLPAAASAQGISQLNQWKTVGGAYLTTLNSSYGLLIPGLATSTTGCLSVAANGWISPSGSACGSGGGGGGAWPFTPSTYGGIANQSTTTPFWLKDTMVIASTTYFTMASTSGLTAATIWNTGLTAGQLVATDGNKKLVSTTTIGNNQLVNSSVTINSQGLLTGGGSLSLGGTLTLNASTSPTVGYVTSTTTSTSTFVGGIKAPCFSTDGTNCITSTGGSSASSTLLTDTNTFSGPTTFSATSTLAGAQIGSTAIGYNVLVLLRHRIWKAACGFCGALQHGHRVRELARATIRCRRIVAMEFGMCRSGRIGGASGCVIFGNAKRREFNAIAGG